ncbi:MAG: nucleotide sugar dehydrogenase [Pseudomonadota bacterium]
MPKDILEKPSHRSQTQISDKLMQHIQNKSLTVGVVGLGYVGMPLLLTMGRQNIKTIGFDVSDQKVADFNAAKPFLKDLDVDALKMLHENGLTSASSDPNMLEYADIIVMCVPTPLTRNLDPNMTYIKDAAETIARYLRPGQMIILESTTFPGTTEELLKPILESSGLQSDKDFFIAYSPEREDPGNKTFQTSTTPKIIGADSAIALKLATAFYDLFIAQTVPVTSTKIAESAKLMENIFRAVNIGLVNELKTVFAVMGIDIWDVIEAAKTKPFGFMPFYPGPGIGGHCIPIDPLYLTWKSNEHKVETRFIRLATEINQSMPRYVVSGLAEALNDRFAKSINGSNILIIGLAYKKNIDDARESPSEEVIKLLTQRKANLSYYDPYVRAEHLQDYQHLKKCDMSQEALQHHDAAIIMTDHDQIDWKHLAQHVPLIVDTRNATKHIYKEFDNIVKL